MAAFQGFTHNLSPVSSGAQISSWFRPGTPENVASARPLIILLHGYPQNNLMWKDFVNYLPADYDVLVPDLPGYVARINPST